MDILGGESPPHTHTHTPLPPLLASGNVIFKKERFRNFSVTVTMNRLFGDNIQKKT